MAKGDALGVQEPVGSGKELAYVDCLFPFLLPSSAFAAVAVVGIVSLTAVVFGPWRGMREWSSGALTAEIGVQLWEQRVRHSN